MQQHGPSPDDPIQDDEGMLRRVSVKVWAPDESALPPVQVFLPQKPIKASGHPGDVDGLSVTREAITPAAVASISPAGKRYHLARLVAGEFRKRALTIVPKPEDQDRGHCVVPELNILDYAEPDKKRWIKERAAELATCCGIAFRADNESV